MKAVLLGAAGIIGTEIAKYLSKSRLDAVVVADVREDRVASLARDTGMEAASLDVTDSAATADLLKGYDVAINATWYYHNVGVMEACLAAGCDYLDLGGLYHTTKKQLAFDDRFRKEGRIAILGCGKAPGITNILAAREAASFDRI